LNQFIREAQRLAMLNRFDGVVDIYDAFTENNTAYIVMQFLDGLTVKQMLDANGHIPYGTAREILLRVLRTLKLVHLEGLIHRDIAPDNIFITSQGEIKLLDFGAALLGSETSPRGASVILKPGYAPEEQYRNGGNQGPWTDLYAAAATFYKMVTGITPPESQERLESDKLKRPSQCGVDLPQGVEDALMAALAIRSAERARTVDAFALALERGPAPEPVDLGETVAEQSNAAHNRKRVWFGAGAYAVPSLFFFTAFAALLVILAVIAFGGLGGE